MSRYARPLIFAALLGYIVFSPKGLAHDQFNVWSWFHYWTNARYYQELGYKDIYTEAWIAQKETDGPMGKVRRARDLDTYRSRHFPREVPQRSAAWSDERWESFKADLQSLEDLEDRWVGIFLDRGFNGSPAWVSVAHYIDRIVDMRSPLGRWFGRALDPLLVLAMAALLLATTTPLRGLLVLVVFLWLPTTTARFPGSLLQYDVFALLVVAWCLLQRKRLGAAGLCLGVATALRVFPALFIAALLARAVVDRIDGRPPAAWGRFAAGAGIGLVLGIALGCLGPRGPASWSEFADNTATHQQFHRFGDGRVGLEHLFTIPAGAETPPSMSVRVSTLANNRGVFRASQVALLLLLALAARRRNVSDTFILACMALFVVTVASRYYWAILALWPLLGVARRDTRLLVAGSLVAGVPIAACWIVTGLGAEKLFCWLAFERFLLLGFVSACVGFVAGDIRRYGLRSWILPGRPEAGSLAPPAPPASPSA